MNLNAARKITDAINNHTKDLAAVFQAVNSENFPCQITDVWDIAKISSATGFHMAVGPAPDTSLPSFIGECPVVSYLPTPLSPRDMLLGDIEKESIELVHMLDVSQLPCDPTYVRMLHKDHNGDIVAEGHYGGVSPLDPSSRGSILSQIDNAIQKMRCKIHLLCIALNSLIEARHIHGLPTADKAEHATKIGSIVGFLLHTNAPLTELNVDDHLTHTASVGDTTNAGQQSRRAYLRELRKVVESADVVLEVWGDWGW